MDGRRIEHAWCDGLYEFICLYMGDVDAGGKEIRATA